MAAGDFRAKSAVTNAWDSDSNPLVATVDKPAGTVAGDLILIWVKTLRGDGTFATPPDFTSITAIDGSSAFNNDLRLFYKVAGASEPSTYTLTSGSIGVGLNGFIAQAMTYENCTFETSATWEGTSSSTTITIPSVTTGGTNHRRVAFYGQLGNGSDASPYTHPSGWTEREDVVDAITGQAEFASIGVADILVASAGATGTATATASDGSTWHCSVCISLEPNSAGATITLTDPVAVTTGGTAACTITRNTAASGTITYNLTSSATGVATVPATATIADGQTTGTFNITGVSAGSATITATNSADSGETDTATANVSALKGLSVTFGQTNLSGLTFAWFDEASPDLFDAPTVVGTTESTDGSGVLEINLTGTSVAVGNTGFLLIYKAGATAPDDIAFFGRLTVQDIG